jgi:triacylglycerol esterase/lipase EstA (alpha/beta hydrolase family)
MPSVRRTVLAVAIAGSITAGSAGSAQAATGPRSESFAAAFATSLVAPELDTPGANDPTCKPTAARPRPVVLVHGTWENRYDNWASLAPRLKSAGYCVFALNYGDDAKSPASYLPSLKGTGDIRDSAAELASYVTTVRGWTGARQVDIVGHSQGGLLARQYLRFNGGANPADPSQNVVKRLVTLGATHHGTTLSGIATLAGTFGLLGAAEPLLGTAAAQQIRGSSFLQTLNAGGDTLPGVDYTVVATRYDEVTTPYRSTFLTAGPGATVRNVTIQDGCAIDLSDHLSMSYGPRIAGLVRNGLEPEAPRTAPCLPKAPVL